MAVDERKFETWDDFRKVLSRFAELPPRDQELFAFRGQASSRWPLATTLDRIGQFASDQERKACGDQLVREFRRLAAGLSAEVDTAAAGMDWELLGRHHGLPTTILDWTASPYIAAFFAFENDSAGESEDAAVWVLERTLFLEQPTPEITVFDDGEAVRYNPRAVEQRAVFLRVGTIAKSLEDLLAGGLHKWVIPRSERRDALADLDSSLVTRRSLFRDLDGAARTAVTRVMLMGGVQ